MNSQTMQNQQFGELLERFIAVLKQERLSSDILPYQKELFSHLYKEVTRQQAQIKVYTKDEDDESESSHMKNLKQQIYKCETEKINYLLKAYLRIRIKKIQTYCFYLYKNQYVAEKKLSENEYLFMKDYAKMKFKYFEEVVFKNMVKPFRGLAGLETHFTKTNEVKLQVETKQSKIEIREPENSNYVFCQIQGNPDLYRFNADIPVGNVEEKQVIPLNSILYIQYKYVSKLIDDSNAILL